MKWCIIGQISIKMKLLGNPRAKMFERGEGLPLPLHDNNPLAEGVIPKEGLEGNHWFPQS